MKAEINEYRKFLIERLGYFRVKARLSARELSLRLGMSVGYIGKFEMGKLNMPTEVLMDAMKILNVTPAKFFSIDPENYDRFENIFEKYLKLSDKSKQAIEQIISDLS